MAHSKCRTCRRRRLAVIVAARLLGVLAAVRSQTPSQVVAAMMVGNLAEAREDPAVVAAAARRGRRRLDPVGEARP